MLRPSGCVRIRFLRDQLDPFWVEQWAVLDDEDGDRDAAASLRRIAAVVRAGFEKRTARPLPAVRPDRS
ncbi:hypothetical protein [Paractinoplanes globisporus]|uniref:Uncharacterized protein n=1 Tax=Paractinoplanes globisporus TaxID=113565 RepID=A0ABW6WSI8_9ACTN|nr:hypothetical protein [Actinoplanes globisporus]